MAHTFAADGSSMTVDIIQRDGGVLKTVVLPQRRRATKGAGGASVKGSAARLRALQE